MSTVTDALFTWPLGDDAALIPRTAAIADAFFEGRGLVTRAVTAILDHAFGPLGLHRVGLQAVADNDRSRRVAERLGFTQDGVLREYAAFPDERRDLVVYSMLAREWVSASGRAAPLPVQG